jgi:thioredoxin
MKKITILLGFALMISFSACSGKQSDEKSGPTTTPVVSEWTDLTDQGKVMHINAEQFKKLVWDYTKNSDTWVFNGDLPLIIDFYADWCRPCKIIAPIMDELAEEYKGKIRVYKINTDKEKELASVFNIRSIPAVLFVPADAKPQMSVGALPKSTFEQAIKEVLKVQE